MRLPVPRPVNLAPGVWRVPTAPWHTVNSFVLVGRDEVTVVDAGMSVSAGALLHGLSSLGIAPHRVTRLLLTHAHLDHVGGASQLLSRTPAATLVHERDLGYVRTGQPPRGRVGSRLARTMHRFGLGTFDAIDDVTGFRDGDVIGGERRIQVFHTPGHTPGHVSLLLPDSGVLITGDALYNFRDITWPTSSICTDPDLNRRSADVLGDLDYETVAFTHGREISVGARSAIREFLRGRSREPARHRPESDAP